MVISDKLNPNASVLCVCVCVCLKFASLVQAYVIAEYYLSVTIRTESIES